MKRSMTLLLILLLFQNCREAAIDLQEQFNIGALPEVAPTPSNNPVTAEKIDLGRALFFDPILSANNRVSCASCHEPAKGFTDGLDRSDGFSEGIKTRRNAPTLLNAAFNGMDTHGDMDPLNSPQFYDNRALSLEAQCMGPLLSPDEMRGPDLSGEAYTTMTEGKLANIAEYQTMFFLAFSDSVITMERVTQAIATYERTLITPNAPFDRFVRGDKNAMTDEQIRGLEAFITAGCNTCHSGPMFSDYQLHVLGVKAHPGLDTHDRGEGGFAFRTTTLRNLSLTAPYMHNGQLKTLKEVMRFYERKRSEHPAVSNSDLASEFRDLRLNPLNRSTSNEIIAFLEALNDPDFDQSTPARVPSGLPIDQ